MLEGVIFGSVSECALFLRKALKEHLNEPTELSGAVRRLCEEGVGFWDVVCGESFTFLTESLGSGVCARGLSGVTVSFSGGDCGFSICYDVMLDEDLLKGERCHGAE